MHHVVKRVYKWLAMCLKRIWRAEVVLSGSHFMISSGIESGLRGVSATEEAFGLMQRGAGVLRRETDVGVALRLNELGLVGSSQGGVPGVSGVALVSCAA